MTQPNNYTPTTDFSQQESINASGRSTVNTAALDAEFANIETTLDQTLSNLSLLQRDDGALKDTVVEVRCLDRSVLTLMGGYELRGLWADATAYALNDICSNGAYTYVCRTPHTSGGVFDSQYWIQFGFTSGADAAMAAAAAQGSATSAASSATAASNSATAAANSASSIAGSVASASSLAGIAVTKAGEASSSATSAAGSAAAAAASAATINVTNFPTKAGVGATGTWPIGISGNAATATSAASASTASACTGNSATATNAGYATSAGSASTAGYASSAGSAPASDVYAWAKSASPPATGVPLDAGDGIGAYGLMMVNADSGYTRGATYAAAAIGQPAGTWRCCGGGHMYAGQASGAATISTYLFQRIA